MGRDKICITHSFVAFSSPPYVSNAPVSLPFPLVAFHNTFFFFFLSLGIHSGPIRFWGNGAACTFTHAQTIYLYHAVRMTDGGQGRGGPKWPHLPTTKTAQQYMDAWRRKTPRGQLGFPKTRGELRELKEFADMKVRGDQWKKRWLWKARVEERLQFTRSDEARDERAGIVAARAAKRLERFAQRNV